MKKRALLFLILSGFVAVCYAGYGGRNNTSGSTYASGGGIPRTTLIVKGNGTGGLVPIVSTDTMTNPAFVVLTDGATITWTASVNNIVNNVVVTLAGNRTLVMSGWTAGMKGVFIVKQDATGSRTLTLPASSKVTTGGAGAITLTTTASAIDILKVTYDGTNYYWDYGKNYN